MIIRISLIAFCAVFVLQPAKSQKIDSLKALLHGTTDLERGKQSLNIILDKKIKVRIPDLELRPGKRDLLLQPASEDTTETVNTIKGLYFTPMRDVSDPVASSYMDKITKLPGALLATWNLSFMKNNSILLPNIIILW